MSNRFFSFLLCLIMLACFTSCALTTSTTSDSISVDPLINKPVFETDNISHIYFYSVHEQDNKIEVPDKYMPEIIDWLASYTIKTAAPENPPPGTNAHHVIIEYSDGKVVECGLDLIVVNNTRYMTDQAPAPECYYEILTQTETNNQ